MSAEEVEPTTDPAPAPAVDSVVVVDEPAVAEPVTTPAEVEVLAADVVEAIPGPAPAPAAASTTEAGTTEDVGFVAADLAKALEVGNSRDITRRLDPDQKGVDQIDTPGGTQTLTVVGPDQKGVAQNDTPDIAENPAIIDCTPTEPEPPAPAPVVASPTDEELIKQHGLVLSRNSRGEPWWMATGNPSREARMLAMRLNTTPQRGESAEPASESEPTDGGTSRAIRAWDGTVLVGGVVGQELVLPAEEALASRPGDLELDGDLPCQVAGLAGDWLLHGTCVRGEQQLAMVLSADRRSAAVVPLDPVVTLTQPLDNGGHVMRTVEQEKAGFEPDVRLVTTTEGGVTRTVTAPIEEPAATTPTPAVALKPLDPAILRKLPADAIEHGNAPCYVAGDPTTEWQLVCTRPASGNALLKRREGRGWLVVACPEAAVQLIQPAVEPGLDAAAQSLAAEFKGEVVATKELINA